MRRPGPAVAVLGGAALLLAVWVTSTTTVGLLPRQDGDNRFQRIPDEQRPGVTLPDTPHHLRRHHPGLPFYVTVVEYVLLGIVAAALLAFIALILYSRDPKGPPLAPIREAPDDGDAIAAGRLPTSILAAAQRQLVELRTGLPRNAIVACWAELEDTCRDSGLPRRPSETSTEFTPRVLARYDVDPAAVGELAALYREARFSEHRLTEAHRDRAVAALERVLADLQRRHAGGLVAQR